MGVGEKGSGRLPAAVYHRMILGGIGIGQSGKTGNFPGSRSLMDHSFFRSFVNRRLDGIEFFRNGLFCVSINGLLQVFNQVFNTRLYRFVSDSSNLVLPRAFQGGFMICQNKTPLGLF